MMERLSIRYILILIFALFTVTSVCEGQKKSLSKSKSPERSVPHKAGKLKKKKEAKIKEPRSVTRAKREQEKKQEKLDKEYYDYVADSRKRAYKIQTPEVQARMKNNEKEIKSREKARKKRVSSSTKSGKQKYNK